MLKKLGKGKVLMVNKVSMYLQTTSCWVRGLQAAYLKNLDIILLKQKQFCVQKFFWTNDTNFLAIWVDFANRGDILKSKQSDVMSFDLFTKNVIGHHIKSSLSENGTNESILLNKRSYFLKNWNMNLCGAANYENFCVFANFLRMFWHFIQFSW